MRRPSLPAAAVLLVGLLLTAWDGISLAGLVSGGDLMLYRMAARLWLAHGPSAIYDRSLQFQMMGLPPNHPIPQFVSPPLVAVLAMPGLLLGDRPVALLSAALGVGCVIAASLLVAPGAGWQRWPFSVTVLASFGCMLGIAIGQVVSLEALLIALAWRWCLSGRQLWAGVAIALALQLHPQLVLLLAPALWFVSRRTAVVAALLSLGSALIWGLLLGGRGLTDLFTDLRLESAVPFNSYLTLAGLFPSIWREPLSALIVLAGLAVIWLGRHQASLEWAFAWALVASLLASTYLHWHDFTLLLTFGPALAIRLGWGRWLWFLPLVFAALELAWVWGPMPLDGCLLVLAGRLAWEPLRSLRGQRSVAEAA